MAEGDMVFYNIAKAKLGDGGIDWDTSVIRLALVTGYTPDIDEHVDYGDISAFECTNANYTAKGKVVTTSAPTVDKPNNWAEYDASIVTWAALGAGDLSHAILYVDSGTEATSYLIAHIAIVATQPNGGDYSIDWDASGVFTIA